MKILYKICLIVECILPVAQTLFLITGALCCILGKRGLGELFTIGFITSLMLYRALNHVLCALEDKMELDEK